MHWPELISHKGSKKGGGKGDQITVDMVSQSAKVLRRQVISSVVNIQTYCNFWNFPDSFGPGYAERFHHKLLYSTYKNCSANDSWLIVNYIHITSAIGWSKQIEFSPTRDKLYTVPSTENWDI